MTLRQILLSFLVREMFEQVDQEMPHAINVTPAEQEAIERVSALSLHHGHLPFVFFVLIDMAFPCYLNLLIS